MSMFGAESVAGDDVGRTSGTLARFKASAKAAEVAVSAGRQGSLGVG
jgi:hypothetical protein